MDYVGIDLHKKTISICVVDQERKVLDRKRFYCNDPGRIVAFFKELGSFQAVVEATASYEWLVSLIEPLADRKDLFSEAGVGPVTIDVVLSELGDIHLASGNTSDGASAPAHSPFLSVPSLHLHGPRQSPCSGVSRYETGPIYESLAQPSF